MKDFEHYRNTYMVEWASMWYIPRNHPYRDKWPNGFQALYPIEKMKRRKWISFPQGFRLIGLDANNLYLSS